MRWVTRAGVHIDRAATAWLVRRFVDTDAEFGFVDDPAEVPSDAVTFDMRDATYGHEDGGCTFETVLRRHDLDDPALWRIAAIVHEADLEDDLFDAPEAPGLDVVLRGLSLVTGDDQVIELTATVFDGLHAYYARSLLTGRDPLA